MVISPKSKEKRGLGVVLPHLLVGETSVRFFSGVACLELTKTQEKAGKIDKDRLKLALKLSHGRWGKTTPKGDLVLVRESLCPERRVFFGKGLLFLQGSIFRGCRYSSKELSSLHFLEMFKTFRAPFFVKDPFRDGEKILDAQIDSDFKSNPPAIWNHAHMKSLQFQL